MYLVERGKPGRWTYFFEVFGKNTLFIYLLSEIAVVLLFTLKVGGQSAYSWLFASVFQGLAGASVSSLLFAVTFMLACWLVGYAMDRSGIYVKV